jgi:hypothetical protein
MSAQYRTRCDGVVMAKALVVEFALQEGLLHGIISCITRCVWEPSPIGMLKLFNAEDVSTQMMANL